MKKWMSLIVLAHFTMGIFPWTALGADCYVATDGSDANPGTASAPFATIAKARDAVRQIIAKGLDHDITVSLGSGVYPQTETLVFGSEDSGTKDLAITFAAAPGGTVVLSGGRAITGWTKRDGNIWTVGLPEVKAGNWYFRQLFVNGRRATRARTPNAGQWWKLIPNDQNSDANDATITLGVDHPIQAWKNVCDIEVNWLINNDGTRKRIGSVNVDDNTFTLPPPHAWPHGMPNVYNISFPNREYDCYFENALEMLDEPGEWYLDRQTGVLSYWPREGEDLASAEVMAPVVANTLLSIEGTSARPVQNLRFQGIRVAFVDWPLPHRGFTGMFGCLQLQERKAPEGGGKFAWIDAAVSMKHARGCAFSDGAIEHTGAIGVAMLTGCSGNVVEGNEIHDLGGGGIVAGGLRNRDTWQWADPIGVDDHKGYRIANNHVHDCGIDYFGSVGILATSMRDSVIRHNLVHDISYSGIVLTGSEVPDAPMAGNNKVEYNHIHHVMQVAQDGAAIYVSFPQTELGALIRGNLIHDTGHRGQPNGHCCGGIYTDGINGRCGPCANYHFLQNVIYHSDAPLMVGETEFGSLLWVDNLMYRGTTGLFSDAGDAPPPEFLDILESRAGLEPNYRRKLLGVDSTPCNVYRLIDESTNMDSWSAQQFHWPDRNAGIVLALRRIDSRDDTRTVCLQALDPDAQYEITDLGTNEQTMVPGNVLLQKGLKLCIDSKPAFTEPASVAVLKAAPPHTIVKYRKM